MTSTGDGLGTCPQRPDDAAIAAVGAACRAFATGAVMAAIVTAAALAAAPAPARAQDVPFETVTAGLKSPDPSARIGSLVLLRQAGYLEAAPAVAPLLADADPTVQGAAVETVLALYLVDVKYTVEAGRRIVKQKGATLPLYAFVQGPGATIANPAIPEVIRGLVAATGSITPTVRFDAAYTLAVLGKPLLLKGQFPDTPKVIDSLIAILRESNPVMKEAATNALGRLLGAVTQAGEPGADLASIRTEAGDLIVGGLNESDANLRLASMGALGEMRYERAVQSLTELFNYHKKGPEALAAFDAVAKIGHPGSIPFFLAQLSSGDAQVRRMAVEGIGRTGDAAAMAQMQLKAGRDQSAYVGHALAFAKARNGNFSEMPKLVQGFKYSSLASDTFRYLVELGPAAALELAAFSTNGDPKIRTGAAEVLGIVGNQTSLVLLDVLMRDRSSAVAEAALRSQKRLVPRAGAAGRMP
ncbi:MAG: putative oxidoreductase/HEAT repeat-containing protein [Acidobacteria bacterium]|nr:putative oxidoreductase/HEAT repeat-containing protein [Acidobacteriota bacterium]